MPLDLCTAPYIFSMVMEVICSFLKLKHKVAIFFYLDDVMLFGKDSLSFNKEIKATVDCFSSLGLTINWKISILTPVTEREYLGTIINLDSKIIRVSDMNSFKCILKAKSARRSKHQSRGQLESLIGSLNFAANYVNPRTVGGR